MKNIKQLAAMIIVVLGLVLWLGMLIERKLVDERYPYVIINYTP